MEVRQLGSQPLAAIDGNASGGQIDLPLLRLFHDILDRRLVAIGNCLARAIFLRQLFVSRNPSKTCIRRGRPAGKPQLRWIE